MKLLKSNLNLVVAKVEYESSEEYKNQLDVTCYFIVFFIGLTCFGHYYDHHQELATIMLITILVFPFLVFCMLEVSFN